MSLTVKDKQAKEKPPLPEPPSVLSEAAQTKWREMAAQLVLRRPDYGAFELDLLLDYCRAYAFKEMANIELATLGTLTYQQRGLELERPQLKTIRESEKAMDRIYRRLGFTKKAEYGGEDESLNLDDD